MRRLAASFGDESRRFELVGDAPVTVGAAPSNDFVVPFPGVSRRHLRVEPAPEGVIAVDLGSKNGLVVRGERRERALLRPGDRVLLGRAVLLLEEVATSDLELALVLEAPAPADALTAGWPGAPPAGETAPHWALRVVRELEALSGGVDEARRSSVLSGVAETVGAAALWTFAVVEGDLFLRDCIGAVPSGEATARIAGAVFPDGGPVAAAPVALDDAGGSTLICPASGGAGPVLVTRYPAGRRPEPWAADLLVHLAERLRLVEGELSGEDLPALVRLFLHQAAARYGKRILGVGRRALELLQGRRWDGRLRELEHAIEGAVLRCPDGAAVEATHLQELTGAGGTPETLRGEAAEGDETLVVPPFAPLRERLEEAERGAIREALERAAGDRRGAAKLLGIPRESLDRKLARLGLG